ncbi:MAG: hypothetical protein M1818_000337 [Claussenomyces sp. TS43310]|nr:MAG: hypothetical protein M1818_000337 [Claussenomyces sp. TS43310]
MPFIPHTPESLIQRSDSKNPAATCRGLTASGRPCRRAVPLVLTSSHQGDVSSFCWQHKDQAGQIPQPRMRTLRERTSADTLVDRLGLLSVDNEGDRRRERPAGRETREHRQPQSTKTDTRRPRPKTKSNSIFVCFVGNADDYPMAPRPIRKTNARPLTSIPRKSTVPQTKQKPAPSRPSIPRGSSSKTATLLSLIPKDASPQATSSLLAELVKPLSEFDEEGYIYMFWLTSQSLPSTPPSEAAPALLDISPRSRPDPGRRKTSDLLQSFSTSQNVKKTMLLKIGRTSNVQRRLNEWNRQCDYNLSLIRYYPYHPTSPGRLSTVPRKVPHAHKVERLIHLELAEKRARDNSKCSQCGREHREWFEIEASKAGVKSVDEVIRRWVDWSLSTG